ncbi:preprotein translocase subunit SecA [Candidatus Falkowbacteria bacterium]|nr:preprotein translocase subunit SecA [Patescibacteria group bacterium]MDD3434971.1 preprotein translocase subunit SecA [Patescibacteria group bacterium]MDD4466341.1 preprotein translocase subunit SecA [Patescibacteria group bacterium]NCU42918.1 preprotein translocase subunit SecA [Candidatus Falkowbacteria bacterium]
MSLISKILGDPNEKIIRTILPLVAKINDFEPNLGTLSLSELGEKTLLFKERLAAGESLDDLLPEAFAVVREASKRLLNKRHYDVQLIGGVVLHRGQIAEMKTGEGKTLVATLPLYLNALEGKGAHLITVNDYLARVGAGWMAPVYYALGLSTSVIIHDAAFIYDPEYIDETQYDERLQHFKPISRREAYYCDITYGTNNEFGFDYLRDNMVGSLAQTVQRDLHYAIVDEIDSILIDEARTPLIISAPAEESSDRYFKFAQLVQGLEENEDYNLDEKQRAVTLTENGLNKMEKLLGVENIYVAGGIKDVHNIEQALKAHVLFKRDKDYVVKEDEIIIVDEFTGRLMPGRRYSEGLHQAIEAKEGVKVQKESQTMATVTFQNLFRMYQKLSGMTGTAVTEAEEFYKIYKLETIVIPTNKPNIRKDYNDLIYRTETGKYQAVIADVKERNAKGQPILIGTISIEKNEILTEMMEREGLYPAMLNAKNHQREAETIAQAGRKGAITLATNMAGRGVDIILGGTPDSNDPEAVSRAKAEQEEVIALGGLHVIGTERHESRRIDNQLRGRAGRQGDPGSSRFYVSTEDDLMRVFGGDRMKNAMRMLKVPEDMPIESSMISKSVESAQKRVEGNNFDTRKHLVEYDDVINKHREAIYQRRREILEIAEGVGNHGDRQLADIVKEIINEELNQIISFHCLGEPKDWNLQEVAESVTAIFPLNEEQTEKILAFHNNSGHEGSAALLSELQDWAAKKYENLKESLEGAGINFIEVEKGILLRSIDQLWVEHLETMDYLRGSIGLRGYGQRDPLVEYKKEAYRLFRELNELIRRQVVYSIYKTGDALELAPQLVANLQKSNNKQNLKFSGAAKVATDHQPGETIDLVRNKIKDESGKVVGRNDLCPCGSGKKFKKCCGA